MNKVEIGDPNASPPQKETKVLKIESTNKGRNNTVGNVNDLKGVNLNKIGKKDKHGKDCSNHI